MDFALWKAVKPDEPSWHSPWGDGRPGWHIECTAMSTGHLGNSLDIHGGGQDLVFPHHENEMAQSECYTGVVPFVRIWMHNGFLQLGTDKMSKSLGNLVTIKEALARNSADAIRLFIISSYYRMPLKYSTEALDAAETGIERMRQALMADGKPGGAVLEAAQFKSRFIEYIDDDFNAPQAVAALFDLVREINRGNEKGLDVRSAQNTLKELAGVIGFTLQETRKLSAEEEKEIEALISKRQEYRKAKEWKLADEVRDRLLKMGVAIEDTAKGTVWKISR
jgi:cysteinyl-tRNA synthetase